MVYQLLFLIGLRIPYKAAYFAFYKNNIIEQCDRVVYALNIKLKELIAHWNKIRDGKKITIKRERFVEFLNLQINYSCQNFYN